MILFSIQTTVNHHFTTPNTYINTISDSALSCLWLAKISKIYGIIKLLILCYTTVNCLIIIWKHLFTEKFQ